MDITKGSIWTSIAELANARVFRDIEYRESDGRPVWKYRVIRKTSVVEIEGDGLAEEARAKVMWNLIFGEDDV